jgi:hypothetical protein
MNSSIEIAEAVKLAQKLIARTREGKLTWEADEIPHNFLMSTTGTDMSEATAFTTSLEGNLRATVSMIKDEVLKFTLVEAPLPSLVASLLGTVVTTEPVSPEKDVLKVSVKKDALSVSVEKDPSYGYDTVAEKQLAGLLVDLYELARRSALKIDGSVEKALSYLDRIAV